MKAFVIKNKEGKYFGYYDSENNRFEFSNKPKRFIMFNTLRDANKIKNLWKMNKCDPVEITIAEGDLLHKIAELKDYIYSYNNEVNNRPRICNEYIDATCKDILEKMKELKL